MRIVIELPDHQLHALDAWRAARGISRAEAIRRAVARLVREDDARRSAILATQGLWSRLEEDGLAYPERLRAEWEKS